MNFEQEFHIAAHAADAAVTAAMKKYRDGNVTDEDDITGILVGRLDAAFDDLNSSVKWSSSILRHRKGIAAEEKAAGADLIIHVAINTPALTYSKGVLIQAKRVEDGELMPKAQHNDLIKQCKKMLKISPASFVFDYTKGSMRCASATKIVGSPSRALHASCNLTSFRFFLELFRCTTGDPNINSARYDELAAPTVLEISGKSSNDWGI